MKPGTLSGMARVRPSAPEAGRLPDVTMDWMSDVANSRRAAPGPIPLSAMNARTVATCWRVAGTALPKPKARMLGRSGHPGSVSRWYGTCHFLPFGRPSDRKNTQAGTPDHRWPSSAVHRL